MSKFVQNLKKSFLVTKSVKKRDISDDETQKVCFFFIFLLFGFVNFTFWSLCFGSLTFLVEIKQKSSRCWRLNFVSFLMWSFYFGGISDPRVFMKSKRRDFNSLKRLNRT